MPSVSFPKVFPSKPKKNSRRKFTRESKAAKKYGLHSPTIAAWRKSVGKTPSLSRAIARTAPQEKRTSSSMFDSNNLLDIVKENKALRAEAATLRGAMEQVKRFVTIQRQLASELLGTE